MKQISPMGIFILVVIGFATGILLIVISNLQRDENPQQAYERGYLDGKAQVYTLWNESLIEQLDILYAKGYILTDSTAWDDSKIYRWRTFDSTDTMPAVESLEVKDE